MPRKPLTPEQKQALVERLAKAREAKKLNASVDTYESKLEELEVPKSAVESAVETVVSVPKPEVKEPEPVEPVDLGLTPWTVDFRDYLPEDLTQKDIDKVVADLKADHKRLEGIFCTDDQAKALKKVTLPKGVFINVGR